MLEKFAGGARREAELACKTSEVVVPEMANYIETDACVDACGVDRNSVGISSDFLHEPRFAAKLCSSACFQSCPNIVDLYDNVVSGEGNAVVIIARNNITREKKIKRKKELLF